MDTRSIAGAHLVMVANLLSERYAVFTSRLMIVGLCLTPRYFRRHIKHNVINVEYCNSVKSIKYICKYVNKGSDMAVFGLEDETAPVDEMKQCQIGR